MRRADRLFRIVQILRNLRFATAEELAERLDVSPRTIYRDISNVVAAGVPVRGEAGVGYCLDRDATLPPIGFTGDEIEALTLGVRMAQAWADPSLGESAKTALAKIESILPNPLRSALDETPLFAPAGAWNTPFLKGLKDIRTAMSEHRRLKFNYTRADGDVSQRTVRPLGLYFWGSVWNLASWCELRKDYRSFRPDRMTDLSMEGHYEPIGEINLAGFLAHNEADGDAFYPVIPAPRVSQDSQIKPKEGAVSTGDQGMNTHATLARP